MIREAIGEMIREAIGESHAYLHARSGARFMDCRNEPCPTRRDLLEASDASLRRMRELIANRENVHLPGHPEWDAGYVSALALLEAYLEGLLG